jgi:hypothetical protein
MNLHELKRAVLQILALLLFLLAIFLGYSHWATSRGEGNARSACNAIQVGMPVAEAEKVATKVSENPRLLRISEGFTSVGYEGAFVDKWLCNVRSTNGHVTELEVRLLD